MLAAYDANHDDPRIQADPDLDGVVISTNSSLVVMAYMHDHVDRAAQRIVGAGGEQRHYPVADELVHDSVTVGNNGIHLPKVGVDEPKALAGRHSFRK
ncbi:hypothetical protein GALL_388810 [mine drainage metagenome]|uniref:Uncharacterized protein n=1 Tax=mine drainage metagenome TaxID=410659 RepID=A0A1J5QHC4_9ZZZZ